jgi:hypothetical protein
LGQGIRHRMTPVARYSPRLNADNVTKPRRLLLLPKADIAKHRVRRSRC